MVLQMKTARDKKADDIEAEYERLLAKLRFIPEFKRRELEAKRRADRYRAAPWLRLLDWLRG